MGKDLWEASPLVRDWYRKAEQIAGLPLTRVSFEGPMEELSRTSVCQPALYVQGMALYWLLQSHCPDFPTIALAGLSLGEWTAHAAAGSLDPYEALELVVQRGRWMEEVAQEKPGAMTAILGLPLHAVEELARKFGVEVANYNAPTQIVLSGRKDRIEKLTQWLQGNKRARAVLLPVSGAFHSSDMREVERKLSGALERLSIRPPRFWVFSNRTGGIVTEPQEIRRSLAEQVSHPVLWEGCLRKMLELGIERFVEIGPGGILCGLVRRIHPNAQCLTYEKLADLIEILHVSQG